jgi:hypothetical protein
MTLSFPIAFPAVAGRPTPYDNKTYAFCNDVLARECHSVVIVPDDIAVAKNNRSTNAPTTMARVLALFAENPDAAMLGPFPTGEPLARLTSAGCIATFRLAGRPVL